jgi:hypothetical protein
MQPPKVFIGHYTTAGHHHDFGVRFNSTAVGFVIAWKDQVVVVKNMNPSAAGMANTGVEVVRAGPGLAEILNAAATDATDQAFDICHVGEVVAYLNLHLLRAGILGQHALQRLCKVIRPVVGWDHDGPERSMR